MISIIQQLYKSLYVLVSKKQNSDMRELQSLLFYLEFPLNLILERRYNVLKNTWCSRILLGLEVQMNVECRLNWRLNKAMSNKCEEQRWQDETMSIISSLFGISISYNLWKNVQFVVSNKILFYFSLFRKLNECWMNVELKVE